MKVLVADRFEEVGSTWISDAPAAMAPETTWFTSLTIGAASFPDEKSSSSSFVPPTSVEMESINARALLRVS
jgi:hypothetical protein